MTVSLTTLTIAPVMATSGPVQTKQGYTLNVDRDMCVTLAVCLGIAPDTFELDAEGKAVIKDADATDLNTLLEACKGCPVNAIILHHPNGKRIWPDPEVDLEGNPLS